MNFSIPCETFARLANVVKWFPPNETRDWLRCVYIEHRNNEAFAVASNAKIAAIEYLGETSGPDGSVKVTIDPALITQCETEAAFKSVLQITTIPELNMASAKTSLGYNYPGTAALFTTEPTHFDTWRKWFPEAMPTAPNGAMYMTAEYIAMLGKSSPSGRLVFPEFIDTRKPVVVRDIDDPNWTGLFLPILTKNSDNSPVEYEPATIPDWVK